MDLDFDMGTQLKYAAPNKEDFLKLFHRTKELFDREGVKFSLAYGSLLGAVREGGLIKGDNDIDLFIWDEDFLMSKLTIFQREGLMLLRMNPGVFYAFTLDHNCWIDVYVLREIKGVRKLFWGKSCFSLFVFETPRSLFTGWSEIDFMGEKITCPKNPERLLEFWYGSDWRIPQSKKGTYTVKSAYYYNRFTAVFYRLPLLWYLKTFKFIAKKEYRQKILKRKKETGSYFFY